MKIIYFLIPLAIVWVVLLAMYLNVCLQGVYFEGFKADEREPEAGAKNTSLEYSDASDRSASYRATKGEVDLETQMIKYRNALNDNHDDITVPVSDVYLPYADSSFEDAKDSTQSKINEFVIINMYKNLLDRQPTPYELNKHLQEFYEKNIDEESLKMRIYNSTEYKMIVKMQSNDVDAGLITVASSENLLDKLRGMYYDLLKKEPEKEMLLPLKDCYIHLQYNDYLFKAMLIHSNYWKFENEVLEAAMLSREKMLEIFNRHFLLSEMRLVANEFKKQEVLRREAVENAAKIPVGIQTCGAMRNAILCNTSNINGSNICFIDSSNMMAGMGSENQIASIGKDANNVFNINIMLGDDMMKSKAYSDDASKRIHDGHGDTCANVNSSNVCKNMFNGMPVDGKCRVYDPIKYKQQYRGDMRYRPNVCSYGTKQVVQPVFVNSRTLFQGTDLREAAQHTQVGSIMPKFEYREYEDVDL
jgi:hypothetical protein